MTAGETLLKITEFPFSYTLVGMIMVGIMGIDLEGGGLVILVAVAGSLATFLRVTNFIGRIIRSNLKKVFNELIKNTKNNNEKIKFNYSVKAVETRAIKHEVNKLTGLVYFTFLLLAFTSTLNVFDSFAERFELIDENKTIVCDSSCVRLYGVVGSIVLGVIVAIFGIRNWKELINQTEIAGIHQLGITSEFVTDFTKENMTKAIDQNDWQTAQEWGSILEKEITTRKGRKETIVEAAKEAFEPLYMEQLQIETSLKSMTESKQFYPIGTGTWDGIKIGRAFLMLEDEIQSKVESFYKKIIKFNKCYSESSNKVQKIVSELAKKYASDGTHIEIMLGYEQTRKTLDLMAPLLYGISLKEKLSGEKMHLVRITIHRGEAPIVHEAEGDLDAFEAKYNEALSECKELESIKEMKKLFGELVKESTKLKNAFADRVKEQWTI